MAWRRARSRPAPSKDAAVCRARSARWHSLPQYHAKQQAEQRRSGVCCQRPPAAKQCAHMRPSTWHCSRGLRWRASRGLCGPCSVMWGLFASNRNQNHGSDPRSKGHWPSSTASPLSKVARAASTHSIAARRWGRRPSSISCSSSRIAATFVGSKGWSLCGFCGGMGAGAGAVASSSLSFMLSHLL